ncbi:Gfo/Idh/MocA family protein [Lewinella sp. JB7]|uniref:Gfo/Idh/MocA family protein n=1 Tax=Lewinella sp. JB7 TaxID=2962887 RepID=UPI0020C9A8C6|nr:Gfo/Idh/MocA family oxidoreductase [Lewinella sp. JB7]MCP9235898.1 Gfo/Idh/MocA family oxidoreductase [Lewinella sp. JB7]
MSHTRRSLLRTAAVAAPFTLIPSWMRAGLPGKGSPNADLQIGVIGCGRQANGLSGVLSRMDGVKVIAACDVHAAQLAYYTKARREEHAAAGAGAVPEIATYADYRALIDHSGLDAVLIATPDHQHAPICIAALEKGLHVYCEKPLAHTIEEGRAMVEATEKSGKVLQTGSMQRSMYNFRHAVKLIQAGKLGEIREAIVSIGPPPIPFDLEGQPVPDGLDWTSWIGPTVTRPYHPTLLPTQEMKMWGKWRDYAEFGGGMVTDWGAHMFDIVQWALGKDDTGPTRFFVPGGDTQEGLTFFYDDGVKVTHRQFGRGNAVRFVGTEGTLDVSRGILDSSVEELIGYGDGPQRIPGGANRAHFAEWFAAIRGEGEVSCPAETGHRTASVCSLANIAYRLGKPLEWDPATERITNNRSANRLLGPYYRMSLA